MAKPRVIAFYLPQYHPTPNNDIWWGKGFTEWTNVGKAKSLYRGHEQPKVPADLGYYDLRISAVREAQAKLAKESGIEGFCYYHYWFKKGHEELDFPFKEIIKKSEPDLPFCLCWANESWNKKFWNIDGSCDKEVLAEQCYDSDADHEAHFYSLLPAFKDSRYIKVNGKLLFMIYKPLDFVNVRTFMDLWNQLAYKNGLSGFHFVGQTVYSEDVETIIKIGFNAVNCVRMYEAFRLNYCKNNIRGIINLCFKKLMRRPFVINYSKAIKYFVSNDDANPLIYPTIIPNWDHTPRSGTGGSVLHRSSPILFKKHVKEVFSIVRNKKAEDNIIFLKSWNEWGEGNYMEPDLKNGKGYIMALREALDESN